MPKIKVNKARCKLCNTTLVSIHRHHFVTCKCGEVSIDGGNEYLRRSATDFNNLEELSEEEVNDGNEQ